MSINHKRLLLALIALIAIVASTIGLVSARKRLRRPAHDAVNRERPSVPRAEQATSGTPTTSAATRLPSHQLVLRASGFEPNEVTWPRERFFLVIDNRTRISDITLRIDRVHGGRLKEVNLKSKKQRSAGVLDLPPGEYVLSEVNHPDWVCRIKILAH
jgi:hypothetical protein